jgi:hypothetical protein
MVTRSDATQGFVPLPRRRVVERAFASTVHLRRLAHDERLPQVPAGLHRLAFARLAFARLVLHRLIPVRLVHNRIQGDAATRAAAAVGCDLPAGGEDASWLDG